MVSEFNIKFTSPTLCGHALSRVSTVGQHDSWGQLGVAALNSARHCPPLAATD